MAKRFCGDVRITISYRWSTNQYKAQVSCTRGTRTVRLTLTEVQVVMQERKMFETEALLLPRDSPDAYDIAAKLALDKAMDAVSATNDIESQIAKEIADSAALGLEAGGYKVLREKDYTTWVGEQIHAALPAMFSGNV